MIHQRKGSARSFQRHPVPLSANAVFTLLPLLLRRRREGRSLKTHYPKTKFQLPPRGARPRRIAAGWLGTTNKTDTRERTRSPVDRPDRSIILQSAQGSYIAHKSYGAFSRYSLVYSFHVCVSVSRVFFASRFLFPLHRVA